MRRVLLSLLLTLGVVAGAAAQAVVQPAGGVAPAAQPTNPYSATVPVAGTSDAQRNAAIAAAFTQVLQQVSPGFTASPDVLAQASGYVRDFHYSRAASGSGLALTVDFDPGAMGRLIAQGGGAPAAQGAATSPSNSTASTGAAPNAPAAGGTGTLWVSGIDSSHAFASLLALLRGDGALHDVVPLGAEGDGVLLHLGYDEPLAKVLADLGGPAGHLAVNPQPHPGADASLRWVP